jgi:hypothetical protein
MKINTTKIRQWHRLLAPIMVLPILLTVITGVIFQIGELGGFEDKLRWQFIGIKEILVTSIFKKVFLFSMLWDYCF